MLEYVWWKYFIQPWIAALIGYITNALALVMTFYPLEFFGLNIWRPKNSPMGLIGWQGVIPTKAEKMASITFDLMTKKLFDIREIFQRLDPAEFSEVMESGILLLIDKTIEEVALAHMPRVWEKVPQEVKDEIVILADRESPKFLTAFMKDMQEHIYDIYDLKDMSVKACVSQKALLNEIFLECGHKELIFIRRSGFWLGLLFGCFQMMLYMIYPQTWVLPICGFIVGTITNWVALQIIFRPTEPKKIGPFIIHGLFLKRQKEVSETFARVISLEIIHTKAMWDAILQGPRSRNFFALLRTHTIIFTNKLIGQLQPIAVAAMGATKFADFKEDVATKVVDKFPSIIDLSYEYTTNSLNLEETIAERMKNLSCTEFEGVLHPAFQEDEWILVLSGGFLGCFAGVLQMFLVF